MKIAVCAAASVIVFGCGVMLMCLSEYPETAQPMLGGAFMYLGWSMRPRKQ